MDITAFGDGRFGVGMMRFGNWEPKWNKKDGSLTITGKREYPIHVTTNHGTFLECTDAKGAVLMDGGDGDWFYVPAGTEPITLRYKQLPDPKLSKADTDKVRLSVTRYVVSDMPHSLGIPDTLAGAVKWMQKQLDSIPKASRAKASFRFDTTMEYGETYPNIEITYSEPETDEEVIRRIQIERERARIQERKERAQLEALQKKLSPSPVE